MLQIAPFLVAKRFAVGDKKLEVARVGLIDVRIINLVNDAVRDRVPEPAAGVIGCPDSFLGALGPARFRARRAEGLLGSVLIEEIGCSWLQLQGGGSRSPSALITFPRR